MKVLCGTDFSEPAKAAAEVAAYAATRLNVPLSLVHCIADWLAPSDCPAPCHLEAQARDMLNAEADRICAPGQRVELKVFHGSACQHITAAGNAGVALVVMGATGKSAASRLLVGSVAEHVAETVSAPTLVVRNAEPLLEWLIRGRPLKVLCASDISESEEALSMAITKLVLLGPVDLECAHLVQTNAFLLQSSAWALENPDLAIATQEEIIAIQNKVKQRFRNAVGVGPRTVHVHQALGNPAYDLVTIAKEQQADLILVGSHHKHGLQRLKNPSFSRRVLAHAHTNVLCVHLGSVDSDPRASISLKNRTAGPVSSKA